MQKFEVSTHLEPLAPQFFPDMSLGRPEAGELEGPGSRGSRISWAASMCSGLIIAGLSFRICSTSLPLFCPRIPRLVVQHYAELSSRDIPSSSAHSEHKIGTSVRFREMLIMRLETMACCAVCSQPNSGAFLPIPPTYSRRLRVWVRQKCDGTGGQSPR